MDPLTDLIWKDKYRYNMPDGSSTEETPEDSMRRVAVAICPPDEVERTWISMKERYFAPAGRIFAGAGTKKRVTLINCYVSPTIDDSMEGIMSTLNVGAFTQQQGGGIGTDYSTIRPRGAVVKRTGSVSTGVLPFMEMWNSMCMTIKSSGSRRGAMIATLADWHPDIIDFIEAKHEKGRLTNFNVSVLVSDAFMKAVENDEDWELGFGIPPAEGEIKSRDVDEITHISPYWFKLCKNWGSSWYVYRVIKARDLWNKIIQSTFEYAEPGVLFIDRINNLNNLNYCETIHSTNPSLVAGTLVHTREGIFPIEQLEGKAFEVKSLDGKWAPSNCFLSGEDEEVIEIDFGGGATVRATHKHRWPVLHNERLVKLYTGELGTGDCIPLSRNEDLGLSLRPDLTREDGFLAGYVTGDGNCNINAKGDKPYVSFTFGRHELKMAEKIKEMMESRTPGDNKIQDTKEGEYSLWYGSKQTYELFTEIYGLEPGRKRIPQSLWISNDNFIKGFIDGLVSADGSIDTVSGRITITTSKGDLAKDLAKLLSFYGLVATVRYSVVDNVSFPNKETYIRSYERWDVVMSKHHVRRFANVFSLSNEVKQKQIDLLLKGSLRAHKGRDYRVVKSIKPAGKARVWDISVHHEQHVFPINYCYSGNCGEQPLPPNGACDLGAINLAKMVKHPFTPEATPNWKLIKETVKIGVRFLDRVLDITAYPTEAQKIESLSKRRIGFGDLGLGTYLQELGLRYGSPESISMVDKTMDIVKIAAYEASVQLAKELGPFLLFEEDSFCSAPFIKSLPLDLQSSIRKYGIRNGVVLTMAPTGTTSIFYDNVASGIEPTFSWHHWRKVLMPDNSYQEFAVEDYGFRLYKLVHGIGADALPEDVELPPYMVTALDVTVEEHLDIQAACQKHIDSSISKTINCPTSMTIEEFGDVYKMAYDLGLKGCTTYRPSGKRGAVLSTTPEAKNPVPPLVRPEALTGVTYKLKWPTVEQAFYITINDIVLSDGKKKPFEIFINSKSVQHQEWITALTRTISAVFRKFDDPTFLIEELEQVYSPMGGTFMPGRGYVPSIVAMIGQVIERHCIELGLSKPVKVVTSDTEMAEICPKCIRKSYIRSEGCAKCLSCGHSHCGG